MTKRKFKWIVLIVAIVIGCVFANLIPWGKPDVGFTGFSFDLGSKKGSGNVATETRDLRDFESIDVSGVIQVEVMAGKDFSVEVEADDNLLQYVRAEVRRGTLVLSTEKRIKTSNPIRVRVSAPNISDIEASGASKVSVVDLSNSSLNLDVSGATKISLAGETKKFTIDASGASQIDAGNLRSENATVDLSGASSADVNVTGELNAEASGASTVGYSGSPQNVKKNASGASKVYQK